jgi:hypothetical protein
MWDAIESLGTAAAVGVAAWAAWLANKAAAKLTVIENQRRHSELCPRLRVTCEPFNPGSEILRLRVMLVGPPGLDRLDRMTVTIRNDQFRRGEGHQEHMGGPTQEEVRRHIWGPYRFTPHTGPGNARADSTGRENAYEAPLPLGEDLGYQLEHTMPGHWMAGMTQQDWLRERGTVIRIAFTAEHNEYGTWYLPCEIDTADTPATLYIPQTR